jgi:hypothetical protein
MLVMNDKELKKLVEKVDLDQALRNMILVGQMMHRFVNVDKTGTVEDFNKALEFWLALSLKPV